ncbi:hypothetical protein [Mycolicibacterium agri]|uniref:PASTA domain-containing protein n=2 Tax=Mycolicibacterium agri TaxID=36811 RepID=A0A7I9WEE0_MYCAG|nr:hypothetical protein [Mycolicibacterium agri]GFG55626.1 hypothetical protein MAGR_70670 [Mycolicibacterium agri]
MRAAWGMAGGIVIAGLALASGVTATAQPIAPGGAYATIAELEASGYDVNIDRVGNAPLDQCIVTSVRNPQDITRTIWVDNGRKGKHRDRELVTIVVRRTISVSLNCDV